MNRSVRQVALLTVLLAAATFRLYGLDWDGGLGAHPDERYIVGVAEGLSWPHSLNPFDRAPQFAYGHLPLYLLAGIHHLWPTGDPLILGRILAASFDLGTVALTFAVGREIYDDWIGALAAAAIAMAVSHVQQAHFYTADAALTFLSLGAVLFATRTAEDGSGSDAWLAGIWTGLALGTKATAVFLVVPVTAACFLNGTKRWGAIWRCSLAALVAFGLTNPFVLLESAVFWENVTRQAAIVRGAADVVYTQRYHDALPYLYVVVQQLRWGMGWALGLSAFGGLIYALWRTLQRPQRRGGWVMLAWVLPSFAFVGALYAQFPRYLLPITPMLAIYGAIFLREVTDRWRILRAVFGLLVLGSLSLRCVALVHMYRDPHPWIAASEYFYENVPSGTVIGVEAWDHPLPLDTSGYVVRKLPIFEEETPKKWRAIDSVLVEADYLVIASRRGYGSVARWSERYPRTARYYKHLFEGDLGFEPIACFGRYPSLGSLVLKDDPTAGLRFSLPGACRPEGSVIVRLGPLDESSVVYDHPQTIIFRAIE